MSYRDLLIEIGTEELPPKALKSLQDAFASGISTGLANQGLEFKSYKSYATPRRLAVLVESLATTQPDQKLERFGPAIAAAFDGSDNPTPAAKGFAKSCGVDVSDLETGEKDGIKKLLYRSASKGRNSVELIPDIIDNSLSKLPIPKRMRWGSSRVEFVRPVHWVVILFGNEVIDAEILGKKAKNVSTGHRFHHPGSITITEATAYEALLADSGYVIADFDKRKQRIREQIVNIAKDLNASVEINESLLDEVTSLVEWPVALTGSFDEHFLEVPSEAIISSLNSHQKCFCLTDSNGKLLPVFIAISNLVSKAPDQVIEGNERVIRPRLADAAFFYATDKNIKLEDRLEQLRKIVFQQQLGTVYDKADRVRQLSRYIAAQIDADEESCARAAILSKCDLVTEMVGEFADLQGIMGKYYAINDGEPDDVASALVEQYLPRHAGDDLPRTATGCVLALADRIDTVCGLFAIDQPPTGSRDPFALRRSAIGVLRIMVEKGLDIDLSDCIATALDSYIDLNIDKSAVSVKVFEFFLDRFQFWYQEDGISAEVFQSVFVLKPSKPLDFDIRIKAVSHFVSLPEAQALASANKRVANILLKAKTNISELEIIPALLQDPEEKKLYTELQNKKIEAAPFLKQRKYQEYLDSLVEMKPVIDQFFDKVLVMAEEPEIRNNRLALLAALRALYLNVADISYLHTS